MSAEPEAEGGTGPAGALPWVRGTIAVLGAAITLLSIAWSLQLHVELGLVIFLEQLLAVILGMALAIVFLGTRASRRGGYGRPPLCDRVAAVAALGAGCWIAVRYPEMSQNAFYHPIETAAVGAVVVPLLLEALRRTAGLSLVVIVSLFILYGVAGHLVPGSLNGQSMPLPDLLGFFAFDNASIFGVAMAVICTVIVIFTLMGQVLLLSGVSDWFTDLAMSLMGRSRGGAAKISVMASSLFGTISGSAVSNVATTGLVTIPLMRKAGFTGRLAGAVEAVSSTGGQIMPPVMGAAAFIMAEFLQVRYTEVALAAAVPAILFYVAVFIQIDLEAARRGIARLAESEIPKKRAVLRAGWYFILPFAVMIVLMFWLNQTPEKSGMAAVASVILLSAVFGYRGRRIGLRDVVTAVCRAGEASSGIIIIGAMAGIIIGILLVTGLGFSLTFALVQIGQHSLVLMLLLTAVVCIILGMGMPTAGIYMLMATMAAPPLIELGVVPIAAHMFVLYVGILSMVTPPVALAAFAAASIAKADPMQTGFTACRLAWVAFLVPFLFAFSPSLLLIGEPLQVAFAVATAVAGVWLASAGIIGYARGRLEAGARLLFTAAGIALLIPPSLFPGGLYVNLAGAALAAALLGREWLARSTVGSTGAGSTGAGSSERL